MENQLEKNWNTFVQWQKTHLDEENIGKVVLLHDGEVMEIYNDSGDAYRIGREKYGLGNFSIQKIGEQPISLGIFTACLPN